MLPYNPEVIISLWNSMFTTIGSAANLGFYLFGFFVGIYVLTKVVRYFI